MTIGYVGVIASRRAGLRGPNARLGEIQYDPGNAQESAMAVRMTELLSQRGWEPDHGAAGWIGIRVNDATDYRALVEDYKAIKQQLRKELKY